MGCGRRPLRRAPATRGEFAPAGRSLDPENALGQTWFQALRYAHTYDPSLPPYGWLASICARACLMQRGRLAAAWAHVRQLAQRGRTTPTAAAPPEVRTVVHAALAQLADGDRQVLTLRYLFGLSCAEVARVLDVEPAALRQRVLRALRRLQEGPAAAALAAFVDDERRRTLPPRETPPAERMHEPESDACRRLGDALVDGRYAEDPGAWAAHAEACPRCRARVAGYRRLRTLLDASRPAAPTSTEPPADPARAWTAASGRFHRHRRRQRLVAGCGTALVLAVALGVALQPTTDRPTVGRDDPVAYARTLTDRVVRPGGAPVDLGPPGSDFERELRRALDHPAPAVRRTAFRILTLAGRPVDADDVERLLRDAAPNLEAPVELAGISDPQRYVAEALERGRTASLTSVLGLLPAVAAQRGAPIAIDVVEPFLSDRDAEVRRLALMALAVEPTYAANPRSWTLLRDDPSEEVRIAAAYLLARRAEGEALAAHLEQVGDPTVEAYIATLLGEGPRAEALALRRVAEPSTPLPVALAHALALARRRTTFDHAGLAARALATDDPLIACQVANCAAAGDWRELRTPLQGAWQTATGIARLNLASTLARWDVRVGSLDRLETALELLADTRNLAANDVLAALERASDPGIRSRAAEIRQAWQRRD